MTGLRRSLVYWGRSIEKFFLIMLLVCVVMVVFVSIMNGESAIDYIAIYVPMIFSVALPSLAYTNITTSLSHIISMGATRRDSFWGMQIFFHLLMLQGMIVTGIIMLLLPELYATDKVSLCKYIMALYVFSCAMGNVISVAVMRRGMNTAKIIYIGVLVIICLVEVIIMVVSEHIAIPFLGVVSVIAMIAGLILDVISVVVCSKAVREYEVRV